jgi:aspartyl-tRNA(Asn)/glutamyl-tRNA(Gln) amidotransferase subunit B
MFCGCSTAYDGAPPNTHVCPVCLGLPGVLPVINRRAVELVLATGIAVEGTTPRATRWDRKNYFYPDLPKGYQISQYDLPLASGGRLTFDTSEGPLTIRIHRAHLEEDTAKLVHHVGADGRRESLVDFNRSGAPLMEIVTEPDIRSAEGARRYAEELQLLLRTIGASDADMERGQMRVEANVSLRARGTEAFGTRIEVKNMNSFRSVEHAVTHEIVRQAAVLEAGEVLVLETRGWSDDRSATYRMRVKETSDDYRYFPEPDLPPLHVEPAWLAAIREALPELPAARRARYASLGIAATVATTLVADAHLTAGFELTVRDNPDLPVPDIARFITQEYAYASNTQSERTPDGFPGRSNPIGVGTVIREQLGGTLSAANAKEVFNLHVERGEPVPTIIAKHGFRQISDAGALGSVVDQVLSENPGAVADYRAGKSQAIGFLVGQVMRATRGQANAALAGAALRARLDAESEPS